MPEAEGMMFDFKDPSEIKPEYLEVFDNPDTEQYIRTETEEFTAVCPFSGLPDIAHLIIEYYPEGKKSVELKSLKYYTMSYRNIGLYQEGVTTKIYEDLREVLNTSRIKVTTVYNIRGGFETTVIRGSL